MSFLSSRRSALERFDGFPCDCRSKLCNRARSSLGTDCQCCRVDLATWKATTADPKGPILRIALPRSIAAKGYRAADGPHFRLRHHRAALSLRARLDDPGVDRGPRTRGRPPAYLTMAAMPSSERAPCCTRRASNTRTPCTGSCSALVERTCASGVAHKLGQHPSEGAGDEDHDH